MSNNAGYAILKGAKPDRFEQDIAVLNAIRVQGEATPEKLSSVTGIKLSKVRASLKRWQTASMVQRRWKKTAEWGEGEWVDERSSQLYQTTLSYPHGHYVWKAVK